MEKNNTKARDLTKMFESRAHTNSIEPLLASGFDTKSGSDDNIHQTGPSCEYVNKDIHRTMEGKKEEIFVTEIKITPKNRARKDSRERLTRGADSDVIDADATSRQLGVPASPQIRCTKEPKHQPDLSSGRENIDIHRRTKVDDDGSINIFEILGLTLSDICKVTHNQVIRISAPGGPPVPFFIKYLQRLIKSDFTFRDDLPQKSSTNPPNDDLKKRNVIRRVGQAGISATNPIDALFSVYMCADHVLRLLMVEKLFMCKLAFPFIAPKTTISEPTMFLWSMRRIVAEWNDGSEAHETGITEHPLDILSAVRLGKCSKSKSFILNNLLNENSHPTFHNRTCGRGDSMKRMTNGLIEAAVSLPAGKEQDLMKSVGLVLNLRGDGVCFMEQVKFLSEVSQSLLVFLDIDFLVDRRNQEIMSSLFETNAHMHILLCNLSGEESLTDDIDDLLESSNEDAVSVILLEKNYNHVDEKRIILSSLKCCRQINKKYLLEEVAILARCKGFICDEDVLSKSKKVSKEFYEQVSGCHLPRIEFLRLQGEPWKKLVQYERNYRKRKEMDQNIFEMNISSERQNQLNLLSDQNADYIYNCIQHLIDNSVLPTFIMWHRIYLDTHSRKILPKMLASYRECYEQYRIAIRDKKTAEEQMFLMSRLKDKEQEMDQQPFGIEHIFREIGQIYEALMWPPKRQKHWSKISAHSLPNIAVDSLLAGLPFEIMNGDGDSANIPTLWVKAVIKRLKKRLNNQRVFVVSIVGVQSSGKSTFLNTMFGIQFAVSAGRCTRGIFIQLIPASRADYQYVLVVDTEGLRGNEEKMISHDNELATMAIGLSDVTIVNIKGDNMEQIKECLQIVVHAFLRIKAVNSKIRLHQRCIFVHQNVAEPNAKNKLLRSQTILIESLDKITVSAAKEENVIEVSQFSDVIKFDIASDIWYMPDLWCGSPTTAHVNPDYTEMVSQVKDYIFTLCPPDHTYLNLEEFGERVNVLWTAILSDDFVYSFRNHLEIRAHSELEILYNDICLDFDGSLNLYIDQLEMEIKRINTKEELMHQESAFKEKLTLEVKRLFLYCQSKLTKVFDTQTHKDILRQWEHIRLRQLNNFIDRKAVNAQKTLFSNIESARHAIDDQRELAKFEQKLRIIACSIAEKNTRENDKKNGKVDVDCIKKSFDIEMDAFMSRIKQEMPDEKIDIRQMSKQILMYSLPSNIVSYVVRALEQKVDTFSSAKRANFYCSSDVKLKHREGYTGNEIFYQILAEFACELEQKIRSNLVNIAGQKMKFNPSTAEGIFLSLRKIFDDFNIKHENSFSATNTYIAKMYVLVWNDTARYLQELHRRYNDVNGIMTKLTAYRETTWGLYVQLVERECAEKIAAFMLCARLETRIAEAMDKDLYNVVTTQLSRLYNGKFILLSSVLTELATGDNAHEVIEYLADSKRYTLNWLEQQISTLFDDPNDVSKKKKSCLWKKIMGKFRGKPKQERTVTGLEVYAQNKINGYISAVQKALSQNHGDNIEDWTKEFRKSLEDLVTLSKIDLQQVTELKLHNFAKFGREAIKQLPSLQDAVMKKYRGRDTQNFQWAGDVKPHKKVLDQIWGCDEVCPFCSEPCQLSNGHDKEAPHQCIQHRPFGLITDYDGNNVCRPSCSFYVASTFTFTCRSQQSNTTLCQPCRQLNPPPQHPYREYQKYTLNWHIQPNAAVENSEYWRFIFFKFNKAISRYYRLRTASLPPSWKDITEYDAIRSLKTVYRIGPRSS